MNGMPSLKNDYGPARAKRYARRPRTRQLAESGAGFFGGQKAMLFHDER